MYGLGAENLNVGLGSQSMAVFGHVTKVVSSSKDLSIN